MTYLKYIELEESDQISAVVDHQNNNKQISSYENGEFIPAQDANHSFPAFKVGENRYIRLSAIFQQIHIELTEKEKNIDEAINNVKFAKEAIKYATKFTVNCIDKANPYNPKIKQKIESKRRTNLEATTSSDNSSYESRLKKLQDYLTEKNISDDLRLELYHFIEKYQYNPNQNHDLKEQTIIDLRNQTLVDDPTFLNLIGKCNEAAKNHLESAISRASEPSSGTTRPALNTSTNLESVATSSASNSESDSLRETNNQIPAELLTRFQNTAPIATSPNTKSSSSSSSSPSNNNSNEPDDHNLNNRRASQNNPHDTQVLFDDADDSNDHPPKNVQTQNNNANKENNIPPRPPTRFQRLADAIRSKLPNRNSKKKQQKATEENRNLTREDTLADLPNGIHRGISSLNLSNTHDTPVLFDDADDSNDHPPKNVQPQNNNANKENNIPPRPPTRFQRLADAIRSKLPSWNSKNKPQKATEENRNLRREDTLADLANGIHRGISNPNLSNTYDTPVLFDDENPENRKDAPSSINSEAGESEHSYSATSTVHNNAEDDHPLINKRTTRNKPADNASTSVIQSTNEKRANPQYSSNPSSKSASQSISDTGTSSDDESSISHDSATNSTSEAAPSASKSNNSSYRDAHSQSSLNGPSASSSSSHDSGTSSSDEQEVYSSGSSFETPTTHPTGDHDESHAASSSRPTATRSSTTHADRVSKPWLHDPVYIEMCNLQEHMKDDKAQTQKEATESFEDFAKGKERYKLDEGSYKENVRGKDGNFYKTVTYYDRYDETKKVTYFMDNDLDLIYVENKSATNVITAPEKNCVVHGKSNAYDFTMTNPQQEITGVEIQRGRSI